MEQVSDIMSLTTQVSQDAMAHWSDQRRKDFIDTFNQRVRVSRWILLSTAEAILIAAADKQFLPLRMADKIRNQLNPDVLRELYDVDHNSTSYYRFKDTIGGRPKSELEKIVKERTQAILENLPPLKETVRIISPETSKLIEERDALFLKGKQLFEQTEELSGPVDMDDHQDKTVKQFQAFVKEREKKRKLLLNQIEEIGEQGKELNKKINKFLYAGIPGLSEAVLQVAQEHIERSTAFSTMDRRVSEKVQFGDSKAALEVLSTFEKDEVTVSDQIKAQFGAALEQLKLAGVRNNRKALNSKKK